MRNSVLPIPWTQRDSRPRSQAELDQEEQFDIYKAKHLAVPRYCRTELDRLLDHYQDMMSRMIEDPAYVHKVNMESGYTRREIKRAEESLAHLRKKPLYKKGAEPREPPEPKPEPKPWARKVDPEPPPAYFQHLNEILEGTQPALKPTRPVSDPIQRKLLQLRMEYHLMDDDELWEIWKPKLMARFMWEDYKRIYGNE